MLANQNEHLSNSVALDPRQLWYVPNRKLRGQSASVKAVRVFKWIMTGCKRDTEPDEETVFIALHTCAYRSARREGKRLITEAERAKWAGRWQMLRAYLVRRNLGLAYNAIGRFHSYRIDSDDLLSDALFALTRAVDRFNPWRGFRFSTYAYNAITRSLMRRVRQERKYRQLFHMRYGAVPDVAEGLPDFQAEVYMERLKRVLDRNLGNLSHLESQILAQRFQADPKVRPSLQKVGATIGLSKERVRQIQKGAIRKLRVALNDDPVLY